MKPIFFLFLSVTRINPCLKQQRYQKKLQMTHSNSHVVGAALRFYFVIKFLWCTECIHKW